MVFFSSKASSQTSLELLLIEPLVRSFDSTDNLLHCAGYMSMDQFLGEDDRHSTITNLKHHILPSHHLTPCMIRSNS